MGISIIPPIKMYKEACPTKLIEYMSCKMAIIANDEIPFQQKLLKENIGYSVSWNKNSIIKGLQNLIEDKKIEIKKQKSFKIYKRYFNPEIYQKKFYKNILL